MSSYNLSKTKDDIAKKLAKLAEFSQILMRNSEDARARNRSVAEGQRLQYVIDTNVLTTFILPSQGWSSVELFHAAPWTFDVAQAETNLDSAMVASELILQTAKAANRSESILMTEQHYSELDGTIKEILGRIDRRVSSDADPEAARRAEESYKKSMDALARASHLLSHLDEARQAYQSDRRFQALGGRPDPADPVPDWALSNYIVRQMCRALAEDEYSEPVSQIARLQKDILPQVRIVDTARPLPGHLTDSIADWETLIWNEFYLSKSRYSGDLDSLTGALSKKRTNQAVHSDAQAMVYLSWRNDTRRADEPFYVFVTADKVLANAYRRHFVNSKSDQPYLVRQLSHFAPLFNLKDGGSRHAPAFEIFDRTRYAIEQLLMPLDLARTGGRDSGLGISSAASLSRDEFSLNASYYGAEEDGTFDRAFLMPYSPEYMTAQEQRLDAAVLPLQALEQYAVGALPDLIQNRIDEPKERLWERISANDDDADQAIKEWIDEKFRDITTNSFRFAVQGAAASIMLHETPSDALPLSREFRLRLQFGTPRAEFDQTAFIEMLREKPDNDAVLDELYKMQKRPHLIFALASVLAFQRQHWVEAIQFAGFAASSVGQTEGRQGGMPDRDAVNECRYLKAVAQRFRIGSTAHDALTPFFEVAAIWRDEAISGLTDCIRDHEKDDRSPVRPLVRLLRAYSERAAVHLFYCDAACGYDPLGLEARAFRDGLERSLALAVDDLLTCHRLQREVEASLPLDGKDGPNPVRKALYDQVRRQYSANSVSAKLIYRWLTRSPSEDGLLARNASIERGLAALPEGFGLNDDLLSTKPDGLQPIFLLYELAARALDGEDVSASLVGLTKQSDESRARQLPLDTAVIRRFIRDVQSGSFRRE